MSFSKSYVELDLMRETDRIAALTHKKLQDAVRPGITTKELDQVADDVILKQDGIPSFGFSVVRVAVAENGSDFLGFA
jgi:methionyl aminopeptidase